MKKISIDELNAMTPYEVLENEVVKERFISLYEKTHISKTGENFYTKEKYNFIRIIQADANLQKCTGFSIYGCFLDIAVMGMTMEKISQPLLYVLFYSTKISQDKWVKVAKIDISPYGELALRMQVGQIAHADNPVIVYEGDSFQPYVKNGIKGVDYMPKIPRESKKIIGSFIGISRTDGSKDYSWMLEDDIERLRLYSERKNRRTNKEGEANALYTSNNGSIDTGFLEAKTIKHAFNCFPKVKIGTKFSQITTEEIQPMDYGLDENPSPEPDKTEAFGEKETPKEPETITIQDNEDVF